jgi:hypothetical protein
MKPSLLLATAVLIATGLAALPSLPDDPEPRDCPLCGGDASVHKRVMTRLATLQAGAGLAYLDSIF